MFEVKLAAMSARVHNAVHEMCLYLVNLRSRSLLKWYHAEQAFLMLTEQKLNSGSQKLEYELETAISFLKRKAIEEQQGIEAALVKLQKDADELESTFTKRELELSSAFNAVKAVKVPESVITQIQIPTDTTNVVSLNPDAPKQ